MSKRTIPTVVVTVEGGAVQAIMADAKVRVLVVDYDVAGAGESERVVHVNHANGDRDACTIGDNRLVEPTDLTPFIKAAEESEAIEVGRVNKREHNAILAGLRLLQDAGVRRRAGLDEILTDGDVEPLTAEEIDGLCQKVNS